MVQTGFTSTSMDKDAALKFASSYNDKKATLFEILWKEKYGGCSHMDMSAFPNE